MSASRDGAVSFAFLLLMLTGWQDDNGNSFDDPPQRPVGRKSTWAMCRDGVASLAVSLLALMDYEEGDRSWSGEPSNEGSTTERTG